MGQQGPFLFMEWKLGLICWDVWRTNSWGFHSDAWQVYHGEAHLKGDSHRESSHSLLNFSMEHKWRFGFSVLSKLAQEVHSTTGDYIWLFFSAGLAASSGRMVLVVDVNGECWRSATWGVISISTDLISMISSLTHFTNSQTGSCRCWCDVGSEAHGLLLDIGPPVVKEDPRHCFFILPAPLLSSPLLALPGFSSFLLSSPLPSLLSSPLLCKIKCTLKLWLLVNFVLNWKWRENVLNSSANFLCEY